MLSAISVILPVVPKMNDTSLVFSRIWNRFGCCLAAALIVSIDLVHAALPGARDVTFQTLPMDGLPNATVVLPDGKILIGGNFTVIGGAARPGLARLNSDGSLDDSFVPPIAATGLFGKPVVSAIIRQTNGQFIVAGQPSFYTTGAVVRTNIVRFNSDGTVDPTVSANSASYLSGLALQADGKVLFSTFLTPAGVYGPTRLNADGSADSTFHYATGIQKGLLALQLYAQTDGHILVLEGDNNPAVGGIQNLVWFKADGSLDTSFKFQVQLQDESRFAVAADGSLLVAGFQAPPSNFTPQIQKLGSDGTPDPNFILLTQPNNQGQQPVPAAFLPDGGAVIVRNPTAGDRRVSFFYLTSSGKLAGSLDLANAANLPGLGTQTTRAFAVQPDGKLLFAQVFVDGIQNTFGLFRLPIPPAPSLPVISTQPQTQTIGAGESLSLGVTATSGSPLTYQWQHAGTNLSNQTGPNLFLSQSSKERAGDFQTIVGNTFGMVTSQVATITVRPPAPMLMTQQPIGGSVKLSQSYSFTAFCSTEVTTGYQWYKNNVPLVGASGQGLGSASVNLPANDATRTGDYFVVFTNDFGGSLTSAVVHLDLILPGPPQISTQPTDLALFASQPVSLNVAATADGLLTYQWQHAGTNLKTSASIPSVTGTSLVVNSSNADRFGAYSVVATVTPGGSTTSRVAQVTLLPSGPPILLGQPASFAADFGQYTNVSVGFNGEAPITVFWLHAGTNILFSRGLPGLLYPTLDAPATNASAFYALPASVGDYRFVATNRFGSVTSDVAIVTVRPPSPAILVNDLTNMVAGIGEFNRSVLNRGLVVTNLGNQETTHLLAFKVGSGFPPFRGSGLWQLALGVSNRFYVGENSGAAAATGTWGYAPGGNNYFSLTNFPRVGDVSRLEAFEDGRYGILIGGDTLQSQAGTFRVLGARRPVTNTFTLDVTSSNPIAVTWFKDGALIDLQGKNRTYAVSTTSLGLPPAPGGVNARFQLSIPDIQPSDAGIYSANISNLFPNPSPGPGQPANFVTSVSQSSPASLTVLGYTETNAPPVMGVSELSLGEPTATFLADDGSLLLGVGNLLSSILPNGGTNWQAGAYPAPIRTILPDGQGGVFIGGHNNDAGDFFLNRVRPVVLIAAGGKTNYTATNVWTLTAAGPSTNYIDTSGIVHGAEVLGLLPAPDGVFVAGRFRGQTRFGATNIPFIGSLYYSIGGITLTNASTAPFDRSWDIYLAKYDLAGKLQWVRGFGGTNDEQLTSFTSDGSGHLYLAGSFKGGAKFGDITVESTKRIETSNLTTYAIDGFILKLETDGTPVWVKTVGGTSNGSLANTQIPASVTDADGDIYFIAARDQIFATLQPGIAVGARYLARLNPAGEIQWAQTVVGSSRLAMDADGNVVVAGGFDANQFNLPTVLGASSVDYRPAAGTLLAKFSPGGTLIWARALDERLPFADEARSANTRQIAMSTTGELVAVGTLSSGTTSPSTHSAGQRFDNFELFTTNTAAVNPLHLFIARLASQYEPSAPQLIISPSSQTGFLQDPLTLTGLASGFPVPNFQWLFNGVALFGATNRLLSFTDLERVNHGNYALIASNAYGAVTSAVVEVTPQIRPSMTGWTMVSSSTNYLGAPTNVAVDDARNIYVLLVGYANGAVLELRHFGPGGEYLWRFNDSPVPTLGYILSPLAPLVAPSGEIFIAGRVINQTGPLGRTEGNFVARLNPADGTILWVKNLSGAAQLDPASVRHLDLDRSGHARVVVADNLGGGKSVRTFAFDGAEEQVRIPATLPVTTDHNNSRYAFDIDGGIYFYANRVEALNLGATNFPALAGNGAQSYVLAHYDSFGVYQWSRAFTGPGGVAHVPLLNVDSLGNAIVAGGLSVNAGQILQVGTNSLSGNSYVAKVSPSGDTLWAKAWWLNLCDATVGIDGSVYITGWFRFAPAANGAVTRHVPFGTNYVAGSSITGHDLFVAKLDPDGQERFIRQSGGPEFATEDNAVSYSLAVDSQGVVTASGYTRVPHAGGGLDIGDLQYVWPNLVPFDIANSGGDLPCYYIARLEVDTLPVAPPEITFIPPAPGSMLLRLSWPTGYHLQRQTALVGGTWADLNVTSPYDANIAEFTQGFFRVIANP